MHVLHYKLNDLPEVLLYSHGNGSDIGYIHELLSKLAYSIGINIISYDYEGYGLTNGINPSSSEEGCIRTIDIVYDYLISNG